MHKREHSFATEVTKKQTFDKYKQLIISLYKLNGFGELAAGSKRLSVENLVSSICEGAFPSSKHSQQHINQLVLGGGFRSLSTLSLVFYSDCRWDSHFRVAFPF